MSDHSAIPARAAGDESPEAFLADRQNFWNGFTHFTLWAVIFMVVLLIAMAVFLL
ncbi:MAG: hypothetical protein WB902_23575 [Acetobacteraceae bacterium]|jgi:hypothetical protein